MVWVVHSGRVLDPKICFSNNAGNPTPPHASSSAPPPASRRNPAPPRAPWIPAVADRARRRGPLRLLPTPPAYWRRPELAHGPVPPPPRAPRIPAAARARARPQPAGFRRRPELARGSGLPDPGGGCGGPSLRAAAASRIPAAAVAAVRARARARAPGSRRRRWSELARRPSSSTPRTGAHRRQRNSSLCNLVPRTAKASVSGAGPSSDGEDLNEVIDTVEVESTTPGASLLAKVAVAISIAATATVISLVMKEPSSGPSFRLPQIVDASTQSDAAAATIGYTFSLFGKKVIIPEYTPGWVYFWLLMAAGFGLFISEEALNVWAGVSLARTLCLDGTWQSLVMSFSTNASYIVSTVLWIYWGVCISDMIPFYLGKLFRQTRASEDISSKIGIGKEKALSISRAVQKYGNLIGFVERFSIGVRNPTAFLAGALGISADFFFAGVCFGCLFTLPIQLAVGFVLRERPVVALTSVAAAVGIWTMFPYAAAACTALFFYFRQRKSSS